MKRRLRINGITIDIEGPRAAVEEQTRLLRAEPGVYQTDGRRHADDLVVEEELFERFAVDLGGPTPQLVAVETGFSPLGEGLEARHG